MNKFASIVFLFGIVLFSTGCSRSREYESEPATNNPGNSDFERRSQTGETPPNNLTESDLTELIRSATAKHGFAPIGKTAKRYSFEVRMWINFGMPGDERFLVVRIDKGRKEGLFYKSHDFKDSRKPQPQILADPTGGWDNLQAEVSTQLATPKKLALDTDYFLDRHEGLISVEYADKGDNHVVFYTQHSSSDDASRLITLCEFLSNEFSLSLDCRGRRTSLGPIR